MNLKATSVRVKLFSLFWNCQNHNYSSSLRTAKFTGPPGVHFYIQFFCFHRRLLGGILHRHRCYIHHSLSFISAWHWEQYYIKFTGKYFMCLRRWTECKFLNHRAQNSKIYTKFKVNALSTSYHKTIHRYAICNLSCCNNQASFWLQSKHLLFCK